VPWTILFCSLRLRGETSGIIEWIHRLARRRRSFLQ
jgi:hypothetical protein